MPVQSTNVRLIGLLLPLLSIAIGRSDCSLRAAEGDRLILVYQAKPLNSAQGNKVDIQKAVSTVDRRLDPLRQSKASARIAVRSAGDDRIEVDIPSPNETVVQQVRQLVTRPGTLEFRVLANPRDHASLIKSAGSPTETIAKGPNGRPLARWVPVISPNDFHGRPGLTARTIKREGREVLEILVVVDPYNVTGEYLRAAASGTDESGRADLEFTLVPAGAALFGKLTSENLPDPAEPRFKRQLGIIIDGNLYSAPTIEAPIFDRARITGWLTRQEIDTLVRLFNAGALPVSLREIEQRRIGAKSKER